MQKWATKLPNRAVTRARPVRVSLICDMRAQATCVVRIAGGWAGTGCAAGHGKALVGPVALGLG